MLASSVSKIVTLSAEFLLREARMREGKSVAHYFLSDTFYSSFVPLI